MRLLFCCALCLVLQVKPNWQLEVALHCAALVLSAQSVVYLDVDLRAVESAVACVDRPGSAELVQCVCECGLGLVPLVVCA